MASLCLTVNLVASENVTPFNNAQLENEITE